jgi:hypothetical protein
MPKNLALRLLPETLAIARLDADAEIPSWAASGPFTCQTRSAAELSIVCIDAAVPAGVRAERGWRALEVVGPLDFGEIGILAALAVPLRDARISIFVISSFDTDYVLVRAPELPAAVETLQIAGFRMVQPL